MTLTIFILCLVATFVASWYGGRKNNDNAPLTEQKLNKWQVGISAATTGNSGFIVTGAVGIGYLYGIHWLLLPIAVMIGDLIYWSIFPHKINALANNAKATTISQLLTFDLNGRGAKGLVLLVSLLLTILLSIYVSAQWLAGKKFLSGAFEISDFWALVLFSGTIIIYSAIGGFRGSVYADIVQSVIRIVGTFLALGAVIWVAVNNIDAFNSNINAAGGDFLSIFPDFGFVAVVGFFIGWGAAAVGFGLSNPQIVSRYMAGATPKETRDAWWIYIGFIQLTWVAMTAFGVLLRGVMPDIPDPEAGLSIFIAAHFGAIITGIILADVYATIAATSNGILVSVAQIVKHDLIESNWRIILSERLSKILVILLGITTIILSSYLPGNVFELVVSAVSLLGAGVGSAVMIKVLNIKHTGWSLFATVLIGTLCACLWKIGPYSGIMNEAGIGIPVGLLTNFIFISVLTKRNLIKNDI